MASTLVSFQTSRNSASFRNIVSSFISNPTLVSVLLAFIVGQACSKLTRQLLWSFTVPSTLATICCSITTAIAISHGVSDPMFPLCLGFSIIGMSLSFRLRRYCDVYLKQMVVPFSVLGLVEALDVGVGDSLSELLVGSILGTIVAMAYCLGSLFFYAMVVANIVSCTFGLYFQTAIPLFPLPGVMLYQASPKIILAILVSNPTFVSIMLVLIVVQLGKVFWKFLREKELDFRMIHSFEGMPSTQSALCCAIITSVAMDRGIVDPLFTLSLGIGIIVMYGAIRLRTFSNLLKVVIRLFLFHMHQEDPNIDEDTKIEDLGDTIPQVLVGGILGCLLGIWTFFQYCETIHTQL